VAAVLAIISQVEALREPLETGRPWTGHWSYLSALATLAALISVLNARKPGHGVWAFLVALLVLVMLIPWLEAGGIGRETGRWSRLTLESPWNLFYLLLVVMGVANYLPTRFGLAAACVGVALSFVYLGLRWPDLPRSLRAVVWSAGPLALALGLWVADAASRRPASGRPGLERLWLWFRDGWGVVWALRVEERFNREAALLGWPIRLGWFGLVDTGSDAETPSSDMLEHAERTLKGLLKRFADPSRLDLEAGRLTNGA
jgi:hypothetical protein